MNFESIFPFLLLIAPFAVAFFLEAFVFYLFKLKSFGASVGLCILVNLLSLGVLYIGLRLLSWLGYAFDGLNFPLQVILALWWLSVVFDGLLLRLLLKKQSETIFLASLVMNTLSFILLYLVIVTTH